MSRRIRILAFVLVLGVGGAILAAMWPQPAESPAPKTGTIYDALEALPDWSGAWEADPHASMLEAAIPFTPEYAAKFAELKKSASAPEGNPECKPQGMPLFMEHKGPLLDIFFAPDRVVFASGSIETRTIFTDGRQLKEPDLDYYNGASVGHWEGDTLVVETIGIVGYAKIFPGMENGGSLTISERIRLTAPDKLEDDITLTNPKMFTAPYTYARTLARHRDWEVSDYVCVTESRAEYSVEGLPEPTEAELFASTQNKPPVRRTGKPATNAAALHGGTWASIATLPDWEMMGGMWDMDNHPPEVTTNEFVPLTPNFTAYFDGVRHIKTGDVPSDNYHCRPRGPAQLMKGALAIFYFVYTPGQVTLVPDDSEVRRFYTDGRVHPADLELSFLGHSIAHWEDKALVVDTVGVRPDVQMVYGLNFGGPMQMIERFHRDEAGKLQVATTMIDATALTMPWDYSRTYSHMPDWSPLENYCSQNNRDVDPVSDLQQFDLTPPPQ